jgi:hypothetical protein
MCPTRHEEASVIARAPVAALCVLLLACNATAARTPGVWDEQAVRALDERNESPP